MITTVAGNGTRGFGGDGASALEAELDRPRGIVFDTNDNLFIADIFNHRIRSVDAGTGVITTVAGSGSFGFGEGGFSGDEGLATEARLNIPIDVTVDMAGNVWIADYFNNRVRRIDSETGVITTVAGSGPFGSRGTSSGDNGPRPRPPSSCPLPSPLIQTATFSSQPPLAGSVLFAESAISEC